MNVGVCGRGVGIEPERLVNVDDCGREVGMEPERLQAERAQFDLLDGRSTKVDTEAEAEDVAMAVEASPADKLLMGDVPAALKVSW